MALRKKIEMQDDVFSGISAVFAVAGGLGDTLSFENATEFPVSDDSGFNFDTGQPSVEHFKVKGQSTDWVNTFTPGDGEMTLAIPTHDTGIMELCGFDPTDVSITLPAGMAKGGTTASGKGYPLTPKAVYLGLGVLNDTEDKLLFVKKAKYMAQLILGSDNKPLCVVLTGSIAAGGNPKAFGICNIAPATQTGDGDTQTGDGN